MSTPSGWNPQHAVASCPITTVKEGLWRGHRRQFEALDHTGSLLTSARFHVAPSDSPDSSSWTALYAALDLGVAVAEIMRNADPNYWNVYRFTEIWAQLEAVLDCRNVALLGLTMTDLFDADYATPQALARAARELGVEAMLVPSATLLGDNLIVFPDRVRAGSVLVEVRSIAPNLTKIPMP